MNHLSEYAYEILKFRNEVDNFNLRWGARESRFSRLQLERDLEKLIRDSKGCCRRRKFRNTCGSMERVTQGRSEKGSRKFTSRKSRRNIVQSINSIDSSRQSMMYLVPTSMKYQRHLRFQVIYLYGIKAHCQPQEFVEKFEQMDISDQIIVIDWVLTQTDSR